MSVPDPGADMIREDLEDLPAFAAPQPYSIRSYRPGDEQAWRRIHLAAEKRAEITPELFAREFGTDPERLARRQFYLLDGSGREVGTATAWFDECYRGRRFGRVHWIALVPGHQGRGLSKPLLGAVCRRLKELGHQRAYLTTSTARLPAVGLYLKFGFRPAARSDEELAAWRALARAPGLRPEDLDRLRAGLE